MEDVSLWVSPVVLVSGVGLLILSTSARYGQLHAELRELIRDARDSATLDGSAGVLFNNLRLRTRLLLSALFGLYLSVGLLITGSLVGSLNAIWSFSTVPVIVLTCAGILGVLYSAVQLIRESRIFLHTVNHCEHLAVRVPSQSDGRAVSKGG
jgi:hypothetical protein